MKVSFTLEDSMGGEGYSVIFEPAGNSTIKITLTRVDSTLLLAQSTTGIDNSAARLLREWLRVKSQSELDG